MKPAWDKLMEEFKDSPTTLITDADCTQSGFDLCEKHKVKAFPTIKYGDPTELKDYEGARDLDSLRKFASETLGGTKKTQSALPILEKLMSMGDTQAATEDDDGWGPEDEDGGSLEELQAATDALGNFDNVREKMAKLPKFTVADIEARIAKKDHKKLTIADLEAKISTIGKKRKEL